MKKVYYFSFLFLVVLLVPAGRAHASPVEITNWVPSVSNPGDIEVTYSFGGSYSYFRAYKEPVTVPSSGSLAGYFGNPYTSPNIIDTSGIFLGAGDGDYQLYICNPGEGYCAGGAVPASFDDYSYVMNITVSGGLPLPPSPDNTSTRIDSVEPYRGQVVSSSTPIDYGATGYVNSADSGGKPVQVYIRINRATWVTDFVTNLIDRVLSETFVLGDSFSGDFSVGSITDSALVKPGSYTLYVAIEHPLPIIGTTLPIFSTYVSTTTSFIVGTSTAYSAFHEQVLNVSNSLNGPDGQGNQIASSTCGTTFDVTGCVKYLFVPDPLYMAVLFEQIRNGFLSVLPWGYVTRVASSFATTTPVMPPGISYTFGTSSPEVLQGRSWSINIFEHFDKITTIKSDDGQNLNIWQITEPFFNFIVAMGILFVILGDTVGIRLVPSEYVEDPSLTGREKRALKRGYKKSDDRGESRRALIERRGRDRDSGGGIIH